MTRQGEARSQGSVPNEASAAVSNQGETRHPAGGDSEDEQENGAPGLPGPAKGLSLPRR
jgi:hypothetical protein